MRTPQMFVLPFLRKLVWLVPVSALDETIDIFSCLVPAFLFLISALLIKINAGTNIICSVTQNFLKEMDLEEIEQSAESYCLLETTKWYPTNDTLQDAFEDYKDNHPLYYYNWTCFYLILGAILAMYPKFIWKISQYFTDMPLFYFCKTAVDISEQTPQERETKVKELAELLESKLSPQRSKWSMLKTRPILAYIVVKILYLYIFFLQIIMLGCFLGSRACVWFVGLDVYKQTTWNGGLFPRIGFCTFTFYPRFEPTSIEIMECTFGLNKFNQAILFFNWFLLLITFIATVLNNIHTSISFHENLIALSLLSDIRNEETSDQVDKFIKNFLKYDGQLVLSSVKLHSEAVAQELAHEMWNIYQRRTENQEID